MSAFADLRLQRSEQANEQRHLPKAEALLRMLLGRSPREVYVIYLPVHPRLLQGDPTEAETLLRTAIEQNDTHARAHDVLGQALTMPGRLADGREFRARALTVSLSEENEPDAA